MTGGEAAQPRAIQTACAAVFRFFAYVFEWNFSRYSPGENPVASRIRRQK